MSNDKSLNKSKKRPGRPASSSKIVITKEQNVAQEKQIRKRKNISSSDSDIKLN